MERQMTEIISYMEYLERSLGLNVSVHFSDRRLNSLPEALVTELRPYNVHKNPYCAMIRKEQWKPCIEAQKRILGEETECGGFCHTCHAGVRERIYPIRTGDTVSAYIAVSGYRAQTPPETCRDIAAWTTYLSGDEMPVKLLDTIIPPLVRMFELLFRRVGQGESPGEYSLILQFLHERHGQATLQELCEHFARSKSYISHLFNEKCDQSLPAYCNTLKLEYAKTLLGRFDVPVSEIAADVGFGDVSYFIRCYKGRFGATPLQYRKSLLSRGQTHL